MQTQSKDSRHDDRYGKGLELLNRLNPEGAARVQDSLRDIAPDMGRFIVEFGYGEIYSRPGLDMKTRQVATVAALAGLGNADPQLRFHIDGAMNVGCTPEEIIEIMYVVTVFAGFPAGLNGIFAARDVFRERCSSVAPADRQDDRSRRERGLAALEATSQGAGRAVLDSLGGIAPDMAGFILDFSYGDVISRTVLSPRLKEVVMIACAAARGTMRPQLKVHVAAGLNAGLGREEIVEVLQQMAVYAGFPAALNAIAAAGEVFAGG